MRVGIGWAVAAIAVAACGDGGGGGGLDASPDALDAAVDAPVDAPVDATPWPALVLDVHYVAGLVVSVSASDPARTACTFYSFLRSGCEDIPDYHRCWQGPLAPWITRASLLSAGNVVATKAVEDIWAGASFGLSDVVGDDALVLRLEASDGQRADIPLPDGVVPPRPTIETITYDGTTLHVGWTTTPVAASTSVWVSGGIHGYRCHVAAPQMALDLPWFNGPGGGGDISVAAYAPAPPLATPLGEAMARIGDYALGNVPPVTW